jgi:hypothetical protein
MSKRAVSEIEIADAVFCMADPYAFDWVSRFRPDTVGLHEFYGENKDRRHTYREMEAAIMAEVRAGKRVCAVFYGHPGIFADVPHGAMRKARAEGHEARMEPGISAEACLYADLGIDPGRRGVQSFEATQFLVYQREIDPCALLILWQVALCGDLSCTRFDTTPEHLQILVDKLCQWHTPETEVILYEAAQIAVEPVRAERMPLGHIPWARYKEYTTLVIPPARELTSDTATLAALADIG